MKGCVKGRGKRNIQEIRIEEGRKNMKNGKVLMEGKKVCRYEGKEKLNGR